MNPCGHHGGGKRFSPFRKKSLLKHGNINFRKSSSLKTVRIRNRKTDKKRAQTVNKKPPNRPLAPVHIQHRSNTNVSLVSITWESLSAGQ